MHLSRSEKSIHTHYKPERASERKFETHGVYHPIHISDYLGAFKVYCEKKHPGWDPPLLLEIECASVTAPSGFPATNILKNHYPMISHSYRHYDAFCPDPIKEHPLSTRHTRKIQHWSECKRTRVKQPSPDSPHLGFPGKKQKPLVTIWGVPCQEASIAGFQAMPASWTSQRPLLCLSCALALEVKKRPHGPWKFADMKAPKSSGSW